MPRDGLAAYQDAFVAAALSGDWRDRALSFRGTDMRRRLGARVYANNAYHGLVSALDDTYPAVRAALGADAFQRLAIGFVHASGPGHRGLTAFAEGFPEFLRAGGVPVPGAVADLAALERAWLQAYHAEDAPALALGDLARLDQASLLRAVFRPHPATRVVATRYAADRLLAAHKNGATLPPLGSIPRRGALVGFFRPDADIAFTVLDPASASIVSDPGGLTFPDLAAAFRSEADALASLTRLIAVGAFRRPAPFME